MINDLRQEVNHFSFSINIFVIDSAEMRTTTRLLFRSGEWGSLRKMNLAVVWSGDKCAIGSNQIPHLENAYRHISIILF